VLGSEQRVAFSERNVELLGEAQQHVPARLRSPGFDKAEMARGDFGRRGQLNLSQATSLAPFTQQFADGPG
jgi:hypothetical protein